VLAISIDIFWMMQAIADPGETSVLPAVRKKWRSYRV
jgi:hypothetical protein